MIEALFILSTVALSLGWIALGTGLLAWLVGLVR